MDSVRLIADVVRAVVATLLVGVACFLGMGVAFGQDQGMTKQEAYEACEQKRSEEAAVRPQHGWRCRDEPDFKYWALDRNEENWGNWQLRQQWFYFGCPAGTSWNEDLKKCFDPTECEQRNGAENGMPLIPTARPFKDKCVAGCMLSMEPKSGGCTVLHGVGGGSMHCNGVFQYTGAACSSPPPGQGDDDEDGPPPGEDSCETTPSGIKFCKKPGGDECFTASNGASICWGTGETGQKTSGADAQTRGPGTTEPTPQAPTPPESFDPNRKQGPETTTTTTNNPNGTTTTTTTTIVNNTTVHGTKPPGTPASGGGSGGKGGGEDGDDEGEGGAASTDCTQPPTCTLGESIGCAMLRQSWANTCGALNGADSEQLGDFSNLDSIPGLDTALAEVWNSGPVGSGPPSIGDLDSGWAARGSCPIQFEFSIPGWRSYTLDGQWLCRLLDALASLVLLMGTIHGGMILFSGFRKGG